MLKPTNFVQTIFRTILCATSFAAVAIFLPSALARQGAFGNAQQTPPASAAQDSSASAPAKPADQTTDTKAAPVKSDAKASPAKKPPVTLKTQPAPKADSQANGPAKASSASAPSVSTKIGQASTTKAGQAADTKTGKAGASKTATTKTSVPLTLKTDKDKQSYAVGINVGKGLGQNLKQSGLEIDPAVLTRAIKDVLAGQKQSMTDQEAQETLKALQTKMREEQQLKQQQAAETNKKEGDEFLAANKAKEGVTTLPDGLQYKILQEGTGPKPAASDSVTVNYKGTLVNGTEFDNSYKRNQPATFNVTGIIKGWTEALQLMPVGSKWQVFIPSDLAYGPSGRPPVIGPNSTLVFEVELVSIQPKPAPPAPAPAPTSNPAPAAAAPNASGGNPAPTPNAPTPPKPAPPTPKPEAAPAPKPPAH